MLIKLLRESYRQARFRRRSKENIRIICATRFSKEAFWLSSPMGTSLRKLEQSSPRIKWEIAYDNAAGLPEIYNKSIASGSKNEILVFVHDDVLLDSDKFIQSLDAGLNRFDVVGVAGNTRIVARQPAWAFNRIENGEFIWDWGHLSGAVWHSQPNHLPALSEYGPFPAACEVLDGVFLAASKEVLWKRKVQFDERYDFHFYDMDFCRTARAAGLKLGTWEIPLIHESTGNFGGESWNKNLNLYHTKWETGKST